MNSERPSDAVCRYSKIVAGGLFAVILGMRDYGFVFGAGVTALFLILVMLVVHRDEIYCKLFGHSWEKEKVLREDIPAEDLSHYSELTHSGQVCSVCGVVEHEGES